MEMKNPSTIVITILVLGLATPFLANRAAADESTTLKRTHQNHD